MASVRILDGSVELVPSPGREAGTLESPGEALVVVAQTRGAFEIAVAQPRRGFGTDASFSLDLLDDGASPRHDGGRRSSPDAVGTGAAPSTSLAIVAHVSRRGDLRVGAGQWVAGPSDILPIEGLSITTARRDLTVALRVQTVGTQGQWSRWYREGDFAGSRQRADALTAVELVLQGDASAAFVMACEVMHLGAPGRKAEGRELEFFGLEPIVGFRLEVKNATDSEAEERFDTRSPSAGRLKVFRARK